MRLPFALWMISLIGWAQDTPSLKVQVVDEAGTPIASASVGVSIWDNRRNQFDFVSEPLFQRTDSEGRASIKWGDEFVSRVSEIVAGERGGFLTLWVSAPGYAPKQVHLRYPETENEQIVSLRRGRLVELQIVHPALPDDLGTKLRAKALKFRADGEEARAPADFALLPISATEILSEEERRPEGWQQQYALPIRGLFLGFGVDALGNGHYRCSLPSEVSELSLVIDRPGLLRGYLSPIDPQELSEGRIVRTLPQPGRIVAHIDLSELQAKKNPTPVLVWLVRWLSAYNYCVIETRRVSGEQEMFQIPEVAPGEGWYLMVRPVVEAGNYDRSDFFNDVSAPVEVSEGGEARIEWRYVPLDPERFKGTRQLEVRLLSLDGKPLSDQPFRLVLYLPMYGETIPVAEGRLDSDGRARLTDLYENPPYRTRFPAEPARYYLSLGSRQEYPDERYSFILYEGDGVEQLELRQVAEVGELAPDVELYDLATGEKRTLSEFQGQWLLIEFWATWCRPCHQAMDKLKNLLEEKGDEWRDRLQVLTISIDEEVAGVAEFLKQRGWWEMGRHFWAGGGSNSSPARAYGIEGIPTAFLVRPDGQIVWSSSFRRALTRMSVEAALEQFLDE